VHDRFPLSGPVGNSLRDSNPSELPLSSWTVAALLDWAAWYERGWSTPGVAGWYDATGRKLWAVLRAELGPAFDVGYFSVVLRKLAPEEDA
jgi:hypothetical protein